MTTVEHGTYTLSNGGPTLSYALSLPSSSPNSTCRAAIIAHPFGRLGGCKEDRVVVGLATMLAERGYAVLTYDARGAGESEGSASWTGAAEADDYRELVDQVVLPLFSRPSSTSDSSSIEPSSKPLELLLCGYSFGSLAASACPPSSDPLIRTSYLLLSYPLSVLWALCFFRSSPFTSALDTLVRRGENRVLAIYGDKDQFSGVEKLRAWSARLEKEAGDGGRFKVLEIEGADHFWREKEKKRAMLASVEAWLEEEQ
ncbi:hypothetical protein JCM8097_009250 [Rhodosporidiobolus ruineniae]